MIKSVILCSDARLVQQLTALLSSLSHQQVIESFASVNAFEEAYSEPLQASDHLVGENSAEESPEAAQIRLRELAKSKSLGLIVIDRDVIQGSLLDWLETEKKRLRDLGHFNTIHPPKILVLDFDQPSSPVQLLRHENIDDVVLKPIDPQLFLQKADLHLANKPNPQSTFLFRAQASGDIELGKEVLIEDVSDFGLSIRNPTPITEGLISRFHSTLLGDDRVRSHCFAKAYVSVRHPTVKDQWLIRYSLFGVSAQQLLRLRQFVRSQAGPNYGQTQEPKRTHAAFDKRKPKFKIAVIDPNIESIESIQTTLEENFERVRVAKYSSLTRLLAKLVQVEQSQDQSAGIMRGLPLMIPRDANPERPAIQKGSLSWKVSRKTFEFVQTLTPRPLGELFLGTQINDWIRSKSRWVDAVFPPDQDELSEFLNYIACGNSGVSFCRLLNAEGEIVYCEMTARLQSESEVSSESADTASAAGGPSGGSVASSTTNPQRELVIEFRQVDSKVWQSWVQRTTTSDQAEDEPGSLGLGTNSDSPLDAFKEQIQPRMNPDDFRFDLILIEAGLIRTSIDELLGSIHSAMVRAKLIAKSDPPPKIIVIDDENSSRSVDEFVHPGIEDYLFKPVDRKLLTDKVALALPVLSRTAPLGSSAFVPAKLTGYLCKSTPLVELSEFGLTIQHPTPIRAQSFIRGFAPLLGDQPDGILMRSIGSLQSPNPDAKTYHCYFTFFGASEELYQKIRRWIREDYAQKKEGQL